MPDESAGEATPEERIETAEAVADLRYSETYRGLPDAWKIALQFCPYCSGTGTEAWKDAERACVQCSGSGDLFKSMLVDAFRQGREQGLHDLHQAHEEIARRIDLIENSPIYGDQIKRSMGL